MSVCRATPATGAKLPKVEVAPFVPLTADEVRELVTASPEHVRAAVLLAAGAGLRQGEAFGYGVDGLDLLRGELRVDRQLRTPTRGPAYLAPPKSANSYRTIALQLHGHARALREQSASRLAAGSGSRGSAAGDRGGHGRR